MRRLIDAHLLDLGLCFVALVWGASPTVFKFALAEVDPLTFVIMRFVLLSLVAVAVLLVYARVHPDIHPFRVRRADLPLLIASGLAGYGIYQLFYIEGLNDTTAFATSLLGSTMPLWSVALLALLRVERIRGLQWVGILVSLAGVVWFLLAHPASGEQSVGHPLTPSGIILGDILLCIGAGLFAIYGIVNKRLTIRYSPPELMCYTLLIGTLALAPFGVVSFAHQDWSKVTWALWVILPYSVVFPIYLTYSIWNWAIGKRGVGYVTLYSYAVPVLGGITAIIALREHLSIWQALASAVVLGGMLLARWAIMRRRAPTIARTLAPGGEPAEVSGEQRAAHEVAD
ncbi:MAG TPA: DMT family transporter [Ktedonobacterales bacterium]|nr:DMT family transporter [Ktedonobacterales bacterium]